MSIYKELRRLGYKDVRSDRLELGGGRELRTVVLSSGGKKLVVIAVVDRRTHYWEWVDYEASLIKGLGQSNNKWSLLEVMISPSGFAGDLLFLAPDEGEKTDVTGFYYGEKARLLKELGIEIVRVYVDTGRCYVIQPLRAEDCGPFSREYKLIEGLMDECVKSRDLVTSVYGEQQP